MSWILLRGNVIIEGFVRAGLFGSLSSFSLLVCLLSVAIYIPRGSVTEISRYRFSIGVRQDVLLSSF